MKILVVSTRELNHRRNPMDKTTRYFGNEGGGELESQAWKEAVDEDPGGVYYVNSITGRNPMDKTTVLWNEGGGELENQAWKKLLMKILVVSTT